MTRVIVEEAGQFKVKQIKKIADKRFVPISGSTDKVIDLRAFSRIACTCFEEEYDRAIKIISDLRDEGSELQRQLKEIDRLYGEQNPGPATFTCEYGEDQIKELLSEKIPQGFVKSMLKVSNVQLEKSHLDLLCKYGRTCADILNLRQQAKQLYAKLEPEIPDGTYQSSINVQRLVFLANYKEFNAKYFNPNIYQFEPYAASKLSESYESLLERQVMTTPEIIFRELQSIIEQGQRVLGQIESLR